jgi:hypothetical protein
MNESELAGKKFWIGLLRGRGHKKHIMICLTREKGV